MLEERIDELNPWYYTVQMGGGQRTMPGIGSKQSHTELVDRQNYRYKMLVDPILERYDFKNKSMMDVACNCAYWSSQYVKKGKANALIGIEGRQEYVEQAYLYWGLNDFLPATNLAFVKMDVMDKEMWSALKVESQVDFILCAGILYHVSDYKWLVSKLCSVAKEAILIDTRVSKDEKKVEEPGGWFFDGVEEKVVKVNPNTKSICQILSDNGFKHIEIIPHAGPVPEEMKINDNYETGGRVTILAKK